VVVGAVTAVADGIPVSPVRNSATVAGWTLLSRATGLLRVVVLGAVLGPTYFANAFQTSYFVPNIVFTLIAGPVLAMVVVPGVVRAVGDGGLARAREMLSRVAGWLLLVSAGVVALLAVAAPVVAWTLNVGIPDPEQRARGLWLTSVLVLLVAPQVMLYCLADLGVAAQRACGRFALGSAAPAVENLVLILAVLLAGWYYGSGLDFDHVPFGMVLALGVGSTVAVAVHAALQLFGAARVGLLARPSLRWWQDREATAVTRRLARSVGVAACPAAGMYVLLALASSVPGGVFVVQLSYAVLFALSYVSARAVSMAALPGLAHAAHRQDPASFASAWRQGLSYAVIASLPLLVLLAVLSAPTASLLAHGELRHTVLIGTLATCLAVVAVAQLVGGVGDLGCQALYARLEDRIPRRASQLALGVKLLVGLSALLAPSAGSRLIWLVVAILAGELASAVMVLTRLRRLLRPQRFIEFRPLGGALLATAAMVPVTAVVWWLQRVHNGSQLSNLVVLIAGGVAALGVYALVLWSTMTRRAGAA
jgi:putative peptidoglycan lipid II flippase